MHPNEAGAGGLSTSYMGQDSGAEAVTLLVTEVLQASSFSFLFFSVLFLFVNVASDLNPVCLPANLSVQMKSDSLSLPRLGGERESS